MTRLDLAKHVSDTVGLSGKDGLAAVEAMIGAIQAACSKGESVTLRKFGTFKVKLRKGKKVKYVVGGGGESSVPDREVLIFKASPTTRVNLGV